MKVMMKKILAVMLMLVMSACAEGVMIFDVPGRNRADDLRFELEGGLSVEFCGIVRDLNAEGDIRECVFSMFMVTSEKDTQLNVRSDAVYDSFGRKFPGPVGVCIAGNGTPSEIIADVPTLVWAAHRVPVRVRELPKFSRMKFWFNDREVELRGEETKAWEDWKRIASAKSEALGVWLETEPSLAEMYHVMRNAPDLSKAAKFGGHHYQVFYESVSWHEAVGKCEEIGGHLCTITSKEESDFVTSFINPDRNMLYWLGASDEQTEGKWQWVTGEKFSFTQWNSGEPNGGSGENFLQITTFWNNRWSWNDATPASRSSNAYICEWDY